MLVTQGSQFFLLESALVQVEYIHLLHEDGQRRLRRLSHLLVHALSLQYQAQHYFFKRVLKVIWDRQIDP